MEIKGNSYTRGERYEQPGSGRANEPKKKKKLKSFALKSQEKKRNSKAFQAAEESKESNLEDHIEETKD